MQPADTGPAGPARRDERQASSRASARPDDGVPPARDTRTVVRRPRRVPAPDDRAPHRLRDLGPVGRATAVAVVVLLALPFVVGLVRLDREGWVLNSDDALLGLRSHDVLAGDPPLTGQPSTSETAGGGVRTYHPGPIEMWAFAPLVRVLGGWGMVVGAAIVNLAAVLTVVFLALRRLGPRGGLVAAVLAALLVRSVGTSLLVDPVSSNMWGLAFVAVAVGVWAVLDGDRRTLPLLAWWASWAAQQHLAALVPTATLVLLAVAAVLVPVAVASARRRGPVDRTGVRWLALAGLLALVLWAPVIVQQLTGDDGNITAVITYAGVEGRTTQGFEGALHIAVRSIDPVPVLLRTDVLGADLAQDPGVVATVVVVGTVLLGLVAAVRPRTPRRARLLLTTALVLLPAGLLNASNIPGNTVEVLRINLHRWIWPFSSFLAIGLAWAVGDLLRRRATAGAVVPAAVARARGLGAGRGSGVGLGAVALVVLLAVVPRGVDDAFRDRWSSGVTREVERAVEADMGDADRVLLVPGGAAAELAVVPALTFALEREGVEVRVPERLEPYFGDRGAGTDPDGWGDWDAAYVVTASADARPLVAGRTVVDLFVDGRMAETVPPLADALRAGRPRVNAAGAAQLGQLAPARAFAVRLSLGEASDDPVRALLAPDVVALLDGGVDGVRLDPAVLARHREVLDDRHTTWLSRRVVVQRVEPGEAAALLLNQGEGLR